MNEQRGKPANGQRATPAVGSEFRKQLLWIKAQDFAERIAELIVEVRHDRASEIIGGQLLRSATSIAANIAEGYGRFSQAAYRNHLSFARGSAFESESWLDLLVRRRYLTPANGEELIDACKEIQKLITYRMKMLSGGKTYAQRDER